MVPEEIRAIVDEHRVELDLLVRAGSKSYGIDVEESDDDFVGVYTAPLRRFLSVYGMQELTLTASKPDVTLHEIGKFCRLALKGNPAILETLWNPAVLWADSWGRALIDRRRSFLHRGSLEVYVAYAEAQMKKMMKGKPLHSKGGAYSGKYGAHLIRLLHAGISLAEQGQVMVKVPSELAAMLLRIRRQEVSMGEVLELARPLLARVKVLAVQNELPEKPDFERINDMVIEARLSKA